MKMMMSLRERVMSPFHPTKEAKDGDHTRTPYKWSISSPLVAVGSIAVGISSTLGFGLGGLHLMGDEWMQYNAVTKGYFTMTPAALVGLYLVLVSCAVGPILLGHSLLSIARLRTYTKSSLPVTILYSIIAAGVIICVVLSGIYLIDAFSPYIWYQGKIPKLNTLNQLMGAIIVSTYTVFGVAVLYMIAESLNLIPKAQSLNASQSTQPENKLKTFFNIRNIVLLVLAHIFIFILTLFLPHCWAITAKYPMIAWNSYFIRDSPYSLINRVILYSSDNRVMMMQNDSSIVNKKKVFKMTSVIDPTYVQPVVYLKLYQTVVVYYAMIFWLIICGVVGTYNAKLRRILHHRVNMNYIPKWVSLWPMGASIGELLLTSALMALHIYWFWYWADGWTYRPNTIKRSERQAELDKYARVFAEMAILTMSLLMFPMARNSVWETVFGVPHDRAVKYHRALGVLFWIFATLHMLIYQVKWFQKGTLATNAWQNPNNWIIQGTVDAPLSRRRNDWTIPPMEFTWLLGTISMSAALLRNTIKYELFVYTHIFMALFLFLSFLHAFQSWYYVGAGLLLYGFDKGIRMINSARQFTIESLEYDKDSSVTVVTLPGGTFPSGFFAGQYCYLNIPCVNQFEWHPFTISSSPYQTLLKDGKDGKLTFSIKALKPGSWTYRLGEFADEINTNHKSNLDLKLMDIAIDGPYGRFVSYSEHKVVVLVGGGIGVTPLMSVFGELAARMRDCDLGSKGDVEELHLIWSIRDASLFDVFAVDILTPIISQTPGVYVHLHITGTDAFEVLEPKEILTNHNNNNVMRKNFNEDKNRSVLSGKIFEHNNNIIDIDEENKVESKRLPPAAYSMNNDSGNMNDYEMTGISPIALIKSENVVPKSFNVNFHRGDYGTIFELISSGYYANNATEISSSDVACLVCAPYGIASTVSNLCYKNRWLFQLEEFSI